MRAGGREEWPIKIVEMAGKTLESTLVQVDPFMGNKCDDAKCIPAKTQKNKISCRKNNIGYQIPCLVCPRAGGVSTAIYFGESGNNMHKRMKEHLTKFNSKVQKTREDSAFYKHIMNTHNGLKPGETFESYFGEVNITKSYNKVLTRCVEEGTFIINHKGQVLNSKSEWNQPKIIRTTILQGGSEMAGGRVSTFQRAGQPTSQEAEVEQSTSHRGRTRSRGN